MECRAVFKHGGNELKSQTFKTQKNSQDVRAEIKIDGIDEAIFKSIKQEEKEAISRAKVYQSEEKLVLEIEAEDVSDLRAAINSWLRLIKMCVEVEEVLKNG